MLDELDADPVVVCCVAFDLVELCEVEPPRIDSIKLRVRDMEFPWERNSPWNSHGKGIQRGIPLVVLPDYLSSSLPLPI
jgi:hypothetical protein